FSSRSCQRGVAGKFYPAVDIKWKGRKSLCPQCPGPLLSHPTTHRIVAGSLAKAPPWFSARLWLDEWRQKRRRRCRRSTKLSTTKAPPMSARKTRLSKIPTPTPSCRLPPITARCRHSGVHSRLHTGAFRRVADVPRHHTAK